MNVQEQLAWLWKGEDVKSTYLSGIQTMKNFSVAHGMAQKASMIERLREDLKEACGAEVWKEITWGDNHLVELEWSLEIRLPSHRWIEVKYHHRMMGAMVYCVQFGARTVEYSDLGQALVAADPYIERVLAREKKRAERAKRASRWDKLLGILGLAVTKEL